MAKKTNKTSHVLNLLTNSAPAEDTDSSGMDRRSDASTHTAAPAKVTVVDEGSRNERISQEILNRLSEELEVPDLETIQDAPAAREIIPEIFIPEEIVPEEMIPEEIIPEKIIPKEMAVKKMIPEEMIPEEFTLEEMIPEEILSQETIPEEPPIQIPRTSASQSVQAGRRLGDQLQDNSFHFINVMEELIMQHDLDMILRQYNLCTCNRCKADVCALTLTGLPSKYVVASDRSLSPILNYYKNRYKISILAELSKACTVVRDHPHHER